MELQTPNGTKVQLTVLIVDRPPLGLDMILGMAGISALGGVSVKTPSELRFCGAMFRSQTAGGPPRESTPQGLWLKEITHLRHFFENIVNNFHNTVFHSLFRNTNYFPN